jgi:HPt (histidine-containing phosphotransfer) domain-containing protein
MDDDSAVIDRTALEGLQASLGDEQPTFVNELIDLFLADTPVQLAALGQHLAADERVVVQRIAHSLKSSAAFVGATRLVEASAALEEQARHLTPDEAAGLVAAVVSTGQEAMAALAQMWGRFA